jgi:hypothetical protein
LLLSMEASGWWLITFRLTTFSRATFGRRGQN